MANRKPPSDPNQAAAAVLSQVTGAKEMDAATVIALKNYDWMVRNRGLKDVALDWESGTLVYGDGGATLETLCEPGFTPATRQEGGERGI